MSLVYISVCAYSEEEAREYLGDMSHAYEALPLVHHELATEQGEQATFVFSFEGDMLEGNALTDADMLHDHFTLPALPNAPMLKLEDF